MPDNVEMLLVGAGYMGREYDRVLRGLGITSVVVGRSEAGAKEYEKDTGRTVIAGGIEAALSDFKQLPRMAIVAVSAEESAQAALQLMAHGMKKILLEKPGGMNRKELEQISGCAKKYGADVYLAYNRRYYASVEEAMRIVEEDGGVLSFHFEFTEWSHTIEGLTHPSEVKKNWLLVNSSHVIDLAFFLGGRPLELSSYAAGKGMLKWHPQSCIYTGCGLSEKGALFSYHANWNAPGRWGIELLTAKHRLYLKPLEKLQIQELSSVEHKNVALADQLDQKFKPGLYRQVEAFFSGKNSERLLKIEDQLSHMKFYEEIEKL